MQKPISLSFRDDTPLSQAVNGSNAQRQFSVLASTAHCDLVLRKVYELLGLTPSKMARLLGVTSQSNAYHWINGRHRPSQAYLIRICWLLLLKLDEVNLKRVRTINWDTFEIEWWPGAEPVENDESQVAPGATWRDLPAPERSVN